MKPVRRVVLLAMAMVMTLIPAVPGGAVDAPSELFISEYVEGSSNNKALEIYNGTGVAVDLGAGGYAIEMYFNGGTAPGLTIDLLGTVTDGDVFVVANSSAVQAILAEADQTNGAGWFNGDDAIVLRKGTNVVDSFGQIGTDPGSEWAGGGQNDTLRRSESVCSGDNDASDAFDASAEWTAFAQDTFDGLGSHTTNCNGGEPPAACQSVTPISEVQGIGDATPLAGTDVTIRGIVTADFGGEIVVQQGDSLPRSGIVVFSSGNAAAVGDEVCVTGVASERFGQTQVGGNSNPSAIVEILSSGNSVPAPATVTTGTIATGSPDAEDWEAVLVRVENVTVVDADLGFGEFSVDDGSGAARVDDKAFGYDASAGEVLPFVQGPLFFSFGNYKIEPRTAEDVGVPLPVCDAEQITLVSSVQGNGFSSPLTGDTVTVEAVVTGIFPELEALTVQEEAADSDGDSTTSEGLFLYVGRGFAFDSVELGDVVQATEEVFEFFGNTQLGREEDSRRGIPASFTEVAICEVPSVDITATPLVLPADDVVRESLEGSLVVTTQDLTVTSLFTAYRFGELGVSVSGVLEQPTELFEPGSAEALALEDQNAKDLLFIDDRGEFGNDNDPWFGLADQRAGDIVEAGVEGVLYYSFGDYLLEPIEFPVVVDGDQDFDDRESAPSLDGGNDIGAFNVLNYFNTFGDSDVLRGARNQAEFDVQSAKIVDAIVNLDASVLGLIELENDYEDLYDGDPTTEPSIQTLVGQLNAVAGAGTYDWVRVPEELLTTEGLGGGGLGPDAIANGIIYQPAKVTMVGEAATFDIDALLGGEDPDNNRWPLAASFDIDGQVVTVMVNHFKSKGSTCDDTIVPAGFGDGQDDPQTGSCDLVREYAAERLIEWIETKPTGVNSPDTFVVGDLNSYAAEDPIRIFEDAGYENTVKSYDDGAFTYKFDGRYGSLDYIIASPSAKRLVDDAEVWQLNSAEPYGYLYFNEYIDLTAYASSDHDALVASISKPGKGPKK